MLFIDVYIDNVAAVTRSELDAYKIGSNRVNHPVSLVHKECSFRICTDSSCVLL